MFQAHFIFLPFFFWPKGIFLLKEILWHEEILWLKEILQVQFCSRLGRFLVRDVI